MPRPHTEYTRLLAMDLNRDMIMDHFVLYKVEELLKKGRDIRDIAFRLVISVEGTLEGADFYTELRSSSPSLKDNSITVYDLLATALQMEHLLQNPKVIRIQAHDKIRDNI